MTQNPNVVELCPSSPDKPAKYFTQVFVSDKVKIPEQKPPKEQIVNIQRIITLEDVETIEVEVSGQVGKKVFVAGNVYLGVQYSAKRPEQTVHYVRFQLPFQAIILTDCGKLIDPADPIFDNGYVVHVCVEKLHKKQIDERTILFEILLLVWLEELQP